MTAPDPGRTGAHPGDLPEWQPEWQSAGTRGWRLGDGDQPCPGCGSDAGWELPECPDGHGDSCPERFCARCGLAVWSGVLVRDRLTG